MDAVVDTASTKAVQMFRSHVMSRMTGNSSSVRVSGMIFSKGRSLALCGIKAILRGDLVYSYHFPITAEAIVIYHMRSTPPSSCSVTCRPYTTIVTDESYIPRPSRAPRPAPIYITPQLSVALGRIETPSNDAVHYLEHTTFLHITDSAMTDSGRRALQLVRDAFTRAPSRNIPWASVSNRYRACLRLQSPTTAAIPHVLVAFTVGIGV